MTTISEIQAMFATGMSDHEVYDTLAAQAIYTLAENIAKATAKDTDDPKEEDLRTGKVLDQVVGAALAMSTFLLADVDPEYTAETLACLLDAVENGVPCEADKNHKTPNNLLN